MGFHCNHYYFVWNNSQGHWKQVLSFVSQGDDLGHAETFGVDHHYPGSQNNSLTVVLYGELGTREFAEFHQVLKTYAVKGAIDYVLRHYVKVSTKRVVIITV